MKWKDVLKHLWNHYLEDTNYEVKEVGDYDYFKHMLPPSDDALEDALILVYESDKDEFWLDMPGLNTRLLLEKP